MKKLTKQIAKICSKCKRELKNCPDIETCIKLDDKLPKKKQHYLYVARDSSDYILSLTKLDITTVGKTTYFTNNDFIILKKKLKPKDLNLKKGEQVRIPIPIDNAEVVR